VYTRQIAIWALPTAIAAFVIHALRIAWFQRGIGKPGRARRGSIAQETSDVAH
jgi:uncharacterized membrane protein